MKGVLYAVSVLSMLGVLTLVFAISVEFVPAVVLPKIKKLWTYLRRSNGVSRQANDQRYEYVNGRTQVKRKRKP
jgi:hypothetical protein